MTGEVLDKQMREISEKLQKRDTADAKKAEKEWRAALAKDTAGHVLKSFQLVQTQISDLQAQIDATNPLAPVIRAVGEVSSVLTDVLTRLDVVEKNLAGVSDNATE